MKESAMPNIKLPPPSLKARASATSPAAAKIVQGKLAMPQPCGCSPKCSGQVLPVLMKANIIQAAKKQKAMEKKYKQAARNWSNYACYETHSAKIIERHFNTLNEIHTFMVNHNLAGDDSFPGHCSGGKGNKQNSGTPAVLAKIRTAFAAYLT
jgi:hypothetical protein